MTTRFDHEDGAAAVQARCDQLRTDLVRIEQGIRALLALKGTTPATIPENTGEVWAQLTLAMRHAEDARMRLGKAIQWAGDGESINDKVRRGLGA